MLTHDARSCSRSLAQHTSREASIQLLIKTNLYDHNKTQTKTFARPDPEGNRTVHAQHVIVRAVWHTVVLPTIRQTGRNKLIHEFPHSSHT